MLELGTWSLDFRRCEIWWQGCPPYGCGKPTPKLLQGGVRGAFHPSMLGVRCSLFSPLKKFPRMNTDEEKRLLREQMKQQSAAMTLEQRSLESLRINQRLAEVPVWSGAKTLLGYVALSDEPDISAQLKAAIDTGRTVALPRFDAASGSYGAAVVRSWEEDLVKGRFGVREPRPDCASIPLKQLDLVLVPGLAFSRRGARLGRGGGFYDRLLAEVSGHRCGVAFEWQLAGRVPEEPHDQLLDSILTPARWRPAVR
jgi:5-formyltetrahydrofolate cyclo-ligase